MSLQREVLDALADLLSYPGELDLTGEPDRERQARAIASIRASCPRAGALLAPFEAELSALDPGQREELFARTFDNTDDRSLEIGWQLFGENYARGALMVRLRGLLREHGVPESVELPDHMTHVLRLLGRCPRPLAAALIRGQVRQAADKILEACRAIESPYCGVLEALGVVLTQAVQEQTAPGRGAPSPSEAVTQ